MSRKYRGGGSLSTAMMWLSVVALLLTAAGYVAWNMDQREIRKTRHDRAVAEKLQRNIRIPGVSVTSGRTKKIGTWTMITLENGLECVTAIRTIASSSLSCNWEKWNAAQKEDE